MEKKITMISSGIAGESEKETYYYLLTDSSAPHSPYVSYDYPFLLKGILFGICLKGKGRLKIDFKEYDIKPNTIFAISPNCIFESVERSNNYFAEILFLSMEFLNSLSPLQNYDVLKKIKDQPCIEMSDEKMQELIEYYSFTTKACDKKRNTYKKEIAKSVLSALILLIESFYGDNQCDVDLKISSRGKEIVRKFSDLLALHHRNNRSAAFYADKMCLSVKYLSQTLKNVTGKSIHYWINESVILDAKQLLKTSNMNVTQVSEELNFPNPSFFGRFFKNYVGTTPMKYKDM